MKHVGEHIDTCLTVTVPMVCNGTKNLSAKF